MKCHVTASSMVAVDSIYMFAVQVKLQSFVHRTESHICFIPYTKAGEIDTVSSSFESIIKGIADPWQLECIQYNIYTVDMGGCSRLSTEVTGVHLLFT